MVKYLTVVVLFYSLNLLANGNLHSLEIKNYSGTWYGKQKLTCLNRSIPKIKPDVILNIDYQEDTNGQPQLLVNKQVVPFDCVSPNLVQFKKLIDVTYKFNVISMTDYIGNQKCENSANEVSKNYTYLNNSNESIDDIVFVLEAASIQPLDSFVDEWSFMICNPLLALTSGIKFPEYFQTELHRNYFIKTNEDGFELMFIEDRICENDITKMSFKR